MCRKYKLNKNWKCKNETLTGNQATSNVLTEFYNSNEKNFWLLEILRIECKTFIKTVKSFIYFLYIIVALKRSDKDSYFN